MLKGVKSKEIKFLLIGELEALSPTKENLEEIFILCCAAITELNANKPNWTFIIIKDSDENALYLDNFQIASFVAGAKLSVENFETYLEVILEYKTLLNEEFLYTDEEEEDEQVYECFLEVQEDIIAALAETSNQKRILKSLKDFSKSSTSAQREMYEFISKAFETLA